MFANESIISISSTSSKSGTSPLMSTWAYHLAAAYLIFITLLGFVLNGCFLWIILRDPKKSLLHCFLLNLVISDGFITIIGGIVSTVAAIYQYWPLSNAMCVAYGVTISLAGIGSITTLAFLAFWRLIVVFRGPVNSPLLNRRYMFKCIILSCVIWTYAIAITCPPLFGWGQYGLEAAHISCSVKWESPVDHNLSFIIYLFVGGLILPLFLIISSYLGIIVIVRKSRKVTQRNQFFQGSTPLIHDRKERHLTKMTVCMVGSFLVAWMPYSVLSLLEVFNSNGIIDVSISPATATIPSLFAKTSIVFNPLVYGFMSSQFRFRWCPDCRFLRIPVVGDMDTNINTAQSLRL